MYKNNLLVTYLSNKSSTGFFMQKSYLKKPQAN